MSQAGGKENGYMWISRRRFNEMQDTIKALSLEVLRLGGEVARQKDAIHGIQFDLDSLRRRDEILKRYVDAQFKIRSVS